MDKQEATQAISDFIVFNASDIKQLGDTSPDVAEAFANVLMAIDMKYGSGVLSKMEIEKEVQKNAPSKEVEAAGNAAVRIRFKTFDELEKEYGNNYSKYPSPGWSDAMNPLAGTFLTVEQLKAMVEAFKNNDVFQIDLRNRNYAIAPWMLTSEKTVEQKQNNLSDYKDPSIAVGMTLYSRKSGDIQITQITPKRGNKSFVINGITMGASRKISMSAKNEVVSKLLQGENVGGYFIKELVEQKAKASTSQSTSVERAAAAASQSQTMPLASKSKTQRPSPTQSANSVPENTVLQGNDGNYYQARKNKNGVQQWKKTRGNSVSKPSDDYSKLSQDDLKAKRDEIEEAIKEYLLTGERSDPEYQELEAELDSIIVYID